MTDNLMLLPILVGHFHPARYILLKGRVDDEFLADGVPGQFPGELVLEADLVVFVRGREDPVEQGFDLAVVVHDRLHDPGRHGDGGGGYFADWDARKERPCIECSEDGLRA